MWPTPRIFRGRGCYNNDTSVPGPRKVNKQNCCKIVIINFTEFLCCIYTDLLCFPYLPQFSWKYFRRSHLNYIYIYVLNYAWYYKLGNQVMRLGFYSFNFTTGWVSAWVQLQRSQYWISVLCRDRFRRNLWIANIP